MLCSTLVRVCRLSRRLKVEDNDDDDEMMAVNSDRLVLVKQKNRHVRCCSVSFQTLSKFSVTFLVVVRPKPGSIAAAFKPSRWVQTLSRHIGSGEVWIVFPTACWQLLQSCLPEYWQIEWGPTIWSHENGQILQGRYGCKSKKIWIGRSHVKNSVPARTFHCRISVKIYSSSCDLYT